MAQAVNQNNLNDIINSISASSEILNTVIKYSSYSYDYMQPNSTQKIKKFSSLITILIGKNGLITKLSHFSEMIESFPTRRDVKKLVRSVQYTIEAINELAMTKVTPITPVVINGLLQSIKETGKVIGALESLEKKVGQLSVKSWINFKIAAYVIKLLVKEFHDIYKLIFGERRARGLMKLASTPAVFAAMTYILNISISLIKELGEMSAWKTIKADVIILIIKECIKSMKGIITEISNGFEEMQINDIKDLFKHSITKSLITLGSLKIIFYIIKDVMQEVMNFSSLGFWQKFKFKRQIKKIKKFTNEFLPQIVDCFTNMGINEQKAKDMFYTVGYLVMFALAIRMLNPVINSIQSVKVPKANENNIINLKNYLGDDGIAGIINIFGSETYNKNIENSKTSVLATVAFTELFLDLIKNINDLSSQVQDKKFLIFKSDSEAKKNLKKVRAFVTDFVAEMLYIAEDINNCANDDKYSISSARDVMDNIQSVFDTLLDIINLSGKLMRRIIFGYINIKIVGLFAPHLVNSIKNVVEVISKEFSNFKFKMLTKNQTTRIKNSLENLCEVVDEMKKLKKSIGGWLWIKTLTHIIDLVVFFFRKIRRLLIELERINFFLGRAFGKRESRISLIMSRLIRVMHRIMYFITLTVFVGSLAILGIIALIPLMIFMAMLALIIKNIRVVSRATRNAGAGLWKILLIIGILTVVVLAIVYIGQLSEENRDKVTLVLIAIGIIALIILATVGLALLANAAGIPALAGLAIVTLLIVGIWVIAVLITKAIQAFANLDLDDLKKNVTILVQSLLAITDELFKPKEDEIKEGSEPWWAKIPILGPIIAGVGQIMKFAMAFVVLWQALLIVCIISVIGLILNKVNIEETVTKLNQIKDGVSIIVSIIDTINTHINSINTVCKDVEQTLGNINNFKKILNALAGATTSKWLEVSPSTVSNNQRLTENYIKFIEKINSVDISKLETTAKIFEKMADFSKSIHGNFEKLAESINEDLMPVLEELKETLNKIPDKIDTNAASVSASIGAYSDPSTGPTTQYGMTQQVQRENPGMSQQEVSKMVDSRLSEQARAQAQSLESKFDELIELLKSGMARVSLT